MIKFRLSLLRVTLLSVVGSVIVFGGAMSAMVSLWQPRALDAIVPASGTVALFSNVTREDVRHWSDALPVIRSVPDFTGKLELGLLGLPDGSSAWILSSSSNEVPLPSSNGEYRGQKVLVSDAKAMAMMTGNDKRLESVEAFRHLTRGIEAGAPKIYLQYGQARAANMLPSLLRPLIHASGAVLFTSHGRALTVRLFGETMPFTTPVYAPLSILSPTPDVTLALGNPMQVFQHQLQGLPETSRDVQQGILTEKVRALLGGEWSWTYDILPLLKEESTVSWKSTTGTGAGVAVVLQSRTADARDIQDRLTAFHEQFRAQLTGTTASHRQLDENFAATVLRSDPTQVEDGQHSLGGWTVRETRERSGGRMLLSAMRGGEYVVTNSQEWLDGATGAGRQIGLPSLAGWPVAGGRLSPLLFGQRIADVRGEPGWMWLLDKLNQKMPVLWSLERDGQGTTLSLTLSQL